jgi:hypothetical protein
MTTRKTRVFYIRVEDGVPIILHQHDESPTAEQIRRLGLSYWALSADAYDNFPPVLMHIYYHGELPSGEARDGINAAVVDYVGKLLNDRAGQE